MKNFLFPSIFFLAFAFLFVDIPFQVTKAKIISPSIRWETTYKTPGNYEITSVIETPFEEYFFCGTNTDTLQKKNIFLLKTDLEGHVQWEQNVSITNQAVSIGLHFNPNNTLTIIGNYLNPDTNNWNICVVNVDRDGHILWEKNIGYEKQMYAVKSIMSIESTYFIVGYQENLKNKNQIVYMANVSQKGVLLWEQTFEISTNCLAKAAIQLYDQSYLIVGESISPKGLLNLFAIKINQDGNLIWTRVHEQSKNYSTNAIIQANDHGYIVVGETDAYSEDTIGIFLMKLNETGGVQWEKFYDNSSSSIAKDIIPTNQDGYIITGATNVTINDLLNKNGTADAYIVYVDNYGNKQTETTFGGSGHDSFLNVTRTSDLGFLLTGRSYNTTSKQLDGYAVQLDKLSENHPVLYVGTKTLSFGIIEKAKKGTKQYLTLENGGEGLLSGFISSSDFWINTSDRSFMIPTFGSLQIIVSIDPSDLLEGHYQGELYITSNGGDLKVYVYIIIIDNSPVLTVQPDFLDFGLIRDRSLVTSSFRVLNRGRTNLYGSVQSETEWLDVTTKTFLSNDQTIEVQLDPRKLTNGLHKGSLFIDTNGGKLHYEVRVLCGFPVVIIRITIGQSLAQVNGINVPIDQQNENIVPFILSGRTMVPLRFLSEALGADIQWDQNEKKIVISIQDRQIEVVLFVNEKTAYVNQETVILDVEPMIYQGRVFVPIRFVAESFKADVRYYQADSDEPAYIIIAVEQ
ncbi:MAG: copper amine oxidase N-terminal domain-containing protein [Caldisericia bacterium]|nr:copper amine oxidase N-terminal domain-containing protein [Caldisericia bacterium]MDD4614614.1 copper amine oxidase N-terminal domain-containing protein [Caldisericia bacterium]